MLLVVIESPYAGDVERNLVYLNACILDSFMRGEAPIASHGLYPRALDDLYPDQRDLGITAGYAWGVMADFIAVYTDLGISAGMERAILHYGRHNMRIKRRTVEGWKL